MKFLTAKQVKKLQGVIQEFKGQVALPEINRWKNLSDAELFLATMVQIAVVGNAEPGSVLENQVKNTGVEKWYSALLSHSDAEKLAAIHKTFQMSGTRYITQKAADCKKSKAALENLLHFLSEGGSALYFKAISEVPLERWRIAIVSDELAFIKNKGARDLLIGLGLVNHAIAFDSRLKSIFDAMGIDLPKDLGQHKPSYKAFEKELLEHVCEPIGISGAQFDRILFGKAKDIVAYLND